MSYKSNNAEKVKALRNREQDRLAILRAEEGNMRLKCAFPSMEDFQERIKNADIILENCKKRC